MALNQQFLFFLSILGAFNGLLISGYLLVVAKERLSQVVLAALLFVVSIRIGKSVLMYFAPDISLTILQIGLSACFLIGPLTCLYTISVTQDYQKLPLAWRWHVLILCGLMLGAGFLYPYAVYPELWQTYLYKIINWTWFIYLVAVVVLLIKHRKASGKLEFSTQGDLMLVSVNVGVSLLWLAYFTASYTSYLVGAVSFSFILYISILLMIKHPNPSKSKKYKDKQIDSDVANLLIERLNRMMANDRLYLEATISLPILAKKMGLLPTQLSQLLNDNLNKSFSTYINDHRILYAQTLLRSDANLNMENVAEQCGYNAMSTFYSAFKKVTGITPAKFREQHNNA